MLAQRILLAGLLLAILGCNANPPSGSNRNLDSSDPTRLNQLAQLHVEGDSVAAIQGLKLYVEEYPTDDLAWVILANAYAELDQHDNAKQAYETALVHDPKQFRAITGLGVLHRRAGDLESAMAAYQRAIKIDPNYAQAYSSMAVIELKKFNDEKAVEYGEKSYKLDQTDPVVAANLALVYHHAENKPKRDEMTKVARELGYQNMQTLRDIYAGKVTIRDDPKDGARKDSDRLNQVARVYQTGKVEEAIEGLNKYLAEFPKDDLGWVILGNAHSDLEQTAEAQKAYEQAIEVNPEQFQALTGLGVLRRRVDDLDGAMGYYERAIKINPEHAQTFSSMAVIALKKNDDAKALDLASRGYQLDKADPVVAANLAIVYHYNNDIDNRERMAEVAETLGYRNMDSLRKIFTGELTVRD